MFNGAESFDKDLGSWNVSKGTNFVSEIKNEQNKIDHTTFMTVC